VSTTKSKGGFMTNNKYSGTVISTSAKPADITKVDLPETCERWINDLASIMPDGYSITVDSDWRVWVFVDDDNNPDPDLYCHVQPFSKTADDYWYEDDCPILDADFDFSSVYVWLAGNEASDNDIMMSQEFTTRVWLDDDVTNYRCTLLKVCGFISGLLNVCNVPQSRREIVWDDLNTRSNRIVA
jgi:hypothetical protein